LSIAGVARAWARTAPLWVVCLVAGCGTDEPAPTGAPSGQADPDAARRGDDLQGAAFVQPLAEPELLRFLDVLPAFAEAVHRARAADPVPDRWAVQPLASPATNDYLWQRLGPMVQRRFGPRFGQTWVKVWAAFAAVRSQGKLQELVDRLRQRLSDAKLSLEQKQKIRRQLRGLSNERAVEMPLASAPSANVDLVATYADVLAVWAGLLFVP